MYHTTISNPQFRADAIPDCFFCSAKEQQICCEFSATILSDRAFVAFFAMQFFETGIRGARNAVMGL